MEFTHMHLHFKDFVRARDWFCETLAQSPEFENHRLAYFKNGPTIFVVEQGAEDSQITLAFRTKNCDELFSRLEGLGNRVIEKPTDRHWNVRSAYLKGPGSLTIELEEALQEASDD